MNSALSTTRNAIYLATIGIACRDIGITHIHANLRILETIGIMSDANTRNYVDATNSHILLEQITHLSTLGATVESIYRIVYNAS